MTEILSSAQMRAIEAAAIASGRTSGLRLMERAGAAVVEAILETWPEMARDMQPPLRAAVLCGPGNNGGDGFVVARLLHARGWRVDVYLFGDAKRLPPDARTNHDAWARLGPVQPWSALDDMCKNGPFGAFDLLIDALFGIGLTRPLPAELTRIFNCQFSGELAAVAVAIDIPSGLCADTGRVLRPPGYPDQNWPAIDGLACEADLTVTFHAPKHGHLIEEGPRYCGKLVVKPIGL